MNKHLFNFKANDYIEKGLVPDDIPINLKEFP